MSSYDMIFQLLITCVLCTTNNDHTLRDESAMKLDGVSKDQNVRVQR